MRAPKDCLDPGHLADAKTSGKGPTYVRLRGDRRWRRVHKHLPSDTLFIRVLGRALLIRRFELVSLFRTRYDG